MNPRDPDLSLKDRLTRAILPKRKLGSSSPAGLSKLPLELLDLIFKQLCPREVNSIRLVCTEWEAASRHFFATKYLSRSVFWLTASSLRMLDKLSQRFGPYIRVIFITSDRFALLPFLRISRQYLSYVFDALRFAYQGYKDGLLAPRRRCGPGGRYQQHAFPQYHDRARTFRFLRRYAYNIISQRWLAFRRSDAAMLARIAKRLPHCEFRVVHLNYEYHRLYGTYDRYGIIPPQHALELVIYYTAEQTAASATYLDYVKGVVGEAVECRSR